LSNQVDLTDKELKRYDRHLRLADFGVEKQIKLKQSKVLLVGAGGLGCPIGLYLAAAGVGEIGIADDDIIDISNLQRQIAFSITEIGEFKASVLAKRLALLNPLVRVIEHLVRINNVNVEPIIQNYDLVIDGTDNFVSRFLLADACFLNKISYLHASVYQYQGQISLFPASKSPCFRCLFRFPPTESALPACSEAGILGVVTGTVGLMAATEAIKYLTDMGDLLSGQVLTHNALTQKNIKIGLEADENCPLCSDQRTILKIDKPQEQTKIPGAVTMKSSSEEKNVTQEEASKWIKNDKELCLLDVREIPEYEQGYIGNASLLPLSVLKTLFSSGQCATAEQETTNKQYAALLPQNKEQKILCYCRRGGRSLQATDILRSAGFTNTFSMDGGIEAWTE